MPVSATHFLARARHAPLRRKIAFLLSIATLALAVAFTPGIYRDIIDTRRLDQDSREALGLVESLNPMSGRNKCSSSAVIKYSAAGKDYRITAMGCSAAADGHLHVGAQARVIYVRGAPEIARATSFGVSSSQRAGWLLLIIVWVVALSAFIAAYSALRNFNWQGTNAA